MTKYCIFKKGIQHHEYYASHVKLCVYICGGYNFMSPGIKRHRDLLHLKSVFTKIKILSG